MSIRRKSRELAVQALYQHHISETPLEELIRFHWVEKKYPKAIFLYASDLISGTLATYEWINQSIDQYAKKLNLYRLAIIDRAILQISLYSMVHETENPITVIINEAVEVSKRFSEENSYTMINHFLEQWAIEELPKERKNW